MTYIKITVWVLVLMMLFSIILTYASLMTLTQMAQDNMRLALDGFVIRNSILIHDSVKNGNDLTEWIDEWDFFYQMESTVNLVQNEDFWVYLDEDGNVLYEITAPRVEFIDDGHLRLCAEYEMIYRVEFAGTYFTTMYIPQRVESYFLLKDY